MPAKFSTATAAVSLPATPFTTAIQEVSVRLDNQIVTVSLDGTESSALSLTDPTYLEFEYMQHLAVIVRAQKPEPLRALHLGAAACALARAWDAEYPAAAQTCVDIDGELMRWARETFQLPRAPRLKLREADAGSVLASIHRPRYNVIVRDVFAAGITPEQLLTPAVFQQAHDALLPGGMYLANVGVTPAQPLRELPAWNATFAHVIAIADPKVWRGARRGNVVLAGSDVPFATAEIDTALRRLALPARMWVNPAR